MFHKNCLPVLILTISVFSGSLFAQKPYFQQRADFTIDVSLNDKSKVLNCSETITYTNNSPDTLNFIYFHLWPNAYSNRNTALVKQQVENGTTDLYFADPKLMGWIDSLDFRIDNQQLVWKLDSLNPDICKLELNQPLLPNQSVIITTPFRVKIPSGKFSRMGYVGQSFQLTQWFPKPAVYDREGWHQMPYLDQGEFYSEYGKFKVSITLPSNYIVAATGELQEQSEIDWLNNLAEAKPDSASSDNSFPPSSETNKTITFIQDSIHDFAWFADKRFHVRKSQVKLPHSGKMVETWIYFTNSEPELWKKGLEYVNDGIYNYSLWVGDYPYNKYSAVDGTSSAGEGMEYPMITLIGNSGDAFTLEDVIVHEIGHSWFYGILGSNERRNGYMDEGINSYYELRYVEKKYRGFDAEGKNDLYLPKWLSTLVGANKTNFREGFELTYEAAASDYMDQPVTLTSEDFTSRNYGAVMYRKTALVFDYLKSYLGDRKFDSCMSEFYEKWKFKHPTPDDLRAVLEPCSGKKLDWFFDDLLQTENRINYKVVGLKGNDSITVKNIGKVASPISISDKKLSSTVWYDGFRGTQTFPLPASSEGKWIVNGSNVPELNSKNNIIRKKGLFKKCPSPSFKFLANIADSPWKFPLFYAPVVGWNAYNEWMGGIYFSNIKPMPSRFEFSLTPLYDFKNSDIAGMGFISYYLYPKAIFSTVRISVSGKRFGQGEYLPKNAEQNAQSELMVYNKLDPKITFRFNKKSARSKQLHSVSIRDISIWQDEIQYTSTATGYNSGIHQQYLNFNELIYSFRNSRTIDPFGYNVRLEQGENHLKSSLEFKYRFSYAKFRKGFDIRLFAGCFIQNLEKDRNYNFRMSGWEGYRDYLYDELYFGRNESHGLWDNQFVVRDGGFKIASAIGQSRTAMASLNLSADLPIPLPIKLFADIGTYDGIKDVFEDLHNQFMYDGGICISGGSDFFEIYVPLFYSDDIAKYITTNDIKFGERIRFVFNLNKLSTEKLRNSFYGNR